MTDDGVTVAAGYRWLVVSTDHDDCRLCDALIPAAARTGDRLATYRHSVGGRQHGVTLARGHAHE